MSPETVSAFFDELRGIRETQSWATKTASLRKRVTVSMLADAPSHLRYFSMKLKGKEIGHLVADASGGGIPKVFTTHIDPAYHGLGLGKKLYGEALRQVPGNQLASDRTVSNAASRVWEAMGKKPAYQLSRTTAPLKETTFSGMGNGIGTDLRGRMSVDGSPLYTAKLTKKG